LLVLVWGLFALDRGLFQDDVSVLTHASLVGTVPGLTPFDPVTVSTRRLLIPWFYLAWHTPHPVIALHLLWGLVWLGIALVARQIAGLLAPGNQAAMYLAAALSLCATADFLTTSPVAMNYVVATFALLGALACGLVWRVRASAGALVASACCLVVSLWTVDVGVSALPLLPALIWLAPARRSSRGRLSLLLALWATVLVPYGLTVLTELSKPASYYRSTATTLAPAAWLAATFKLWIVNLAPWTWAFERPAWYSRTPLQQPVPLWVMITLAILGVAAFIWGLRRCGREGAIVTGALRTAAIAVVLGLLSVAANGVYAGVALSPLHYRTHILSGIWTAVLLAVVVGTLMQRWRWVAVVPVVFVAGGIMSGLERQGFFQGSWQQHQRELASIVRAAPALKPGTKVVLWVPEHPRYLATEIWYAQQWLVLLYRDPGLLASSYWSPLHGSGCRADQAALTCWGPGQAQCFAAATCPGVAYPYDTLLVFGFDVDSGTYRVMRDLPTDRPVAPAGYQPGARIVSRPLTTLQRRLLMLGFRSPARWLPRVP
jgi:hypothetical protein